jgi:hypothetical protein
LCQQASKEKKWRKNADEKKGSIDIWGLMLKNNFRIGTFAGLICCNKNRVS